MKRILSLDLLRGASIFFMVVVHTWMNVYDMSPLYSIDISDINPFLLVFGALLFILGHFRSFFLLISMTIHSYAMDKAFNNGTKPEHILKKKVLVGLLIYFAGVFREAFLNPWGILNDLHIQGTINPHSLRMAYLFETLSMIGLGLIILSFVNYCMMKKGYMTLKTRIIIYSLLSIIVIVSTPFVHSAIDNYFGIDFEYQGYLVTGSFWSYLARFFWVALAGKDEPLFPFLVIVFIGAIVGASLSQPKPTKKICHIGISAGLFLVIFGIFYWVFIENMTFNLFFNIHPLWYFIFNAGLQLILLYFFFLKIEFNHKLNMDDFMRWTQFFRRWSMVSLSIYMLQVIDILPRELFYHLLGVDFHNRNQVNFTWSLFMILVMIVFWDVTIRLWEKVDFTGSFEWMLIKLGQIFLNGKNISKTRLRVVNVLYNPEPIVFHNKQRGEETKISGDFTIIPVKDKKD